MYGTIDTSKTYSFSEAWNSLLDNNIITSKTTNGNYLIDKSKSGEVQLKFQHPMVSLWQDAEYILLKEMVNEWYITKIEE